MVSSSRESKEFLDKLIILFYFIIQLPLNKFLRILKISKRRPNFVRKIYLKILFEAWDKRHFDEVKNILLKFNYKIRKTGELNNYFAY